MRILNNFSYSYSGRGRKFTFFNSIFGKILIEVGREDSEELHHVKNSKYVYIGSVISFPNMYGKVSMSRDFFKSITPFECRPMIANNLFNETDAHSDQDSYYSDTQVKNRLNTLILKTYGPIVSKPYYDFVKFNNNALYSSFLEFNYCKKVGYNFNELQTLYSSFGVIIAYDKNPPFVNDVLGISNIATNSIRNHRYGYIGNPTILSMLVMPRSKYYKYRMELLKNETIDPEPEDVKLLVSPKLFEKKSPYKKVTNFLNKSIIPGLHDNGVEVIVEDINQYFVTSLGEGYNLDGLRELFKSAYSELISNDKIVTIGNYDLEKELLNSLFN